MRSLSSQFVCRVFILFNSSLFFRVKHAVRIIFVFPFLILAYSISFFRRCRLCLFKTSSLQLSNVDGRAKAIVVDIVPYSLLVDASWTVLLESLLPELGVVCLFLPSPMSVLVLRFTNRFFLGNIERLSPDLVGGPEGEGAPCRYPAHGCWLSDFTPLCRNG